MKNVQQEKTNVPKQAQEEKQKKENLEKVSGLSNNTIVGNILELKNSLNNSLEELQNKLVREFKQLKDIRSASVSKN